MGPLPRAEQTGAALEVRDLVKWFHSRGTTVRAVNGVSFDVRAGETLALVGESGCGKSTTARCIVRLAEPTSGTITFRGCDVTSLSRREFRPLRRDIQMVFQDPHASLNPSLTVREALREPLKLHRIAAGEAVEGEVQALMRLVQLDPVLLNRRPNQLSGGQKQRVGIARAIATRPGFVVLDEPTSALDMSLRGALLELLSHLQEQLGMTYLFITHDFSTVRSVAERVIVMYLGKAMEEGPVADVLGDPKHPYTQALVSAIPVPDVRRKRERIVLSSEMPSATKVLVGCPFQDRCPHVIPACRDGEIPFFAAGNSKVACLLYAGGEPVGLAPERSSA